MDINGTVSHPSLLFFGKITTGGVVAKIAVLNIVVNPSIRFAALLKKKPKKTGREENDKKIC